MDFVTDRAPRLGPGSGAELLGNLDRPVEGDPGHHLRVGKVLRRPAHLPDSLIGLVPDRGQMLKYGLPDRGAACDRGKAGPMGVVERVENLAKNVELGLVGGAVADAHWARILVPGQPR